MNKNLLIFGGALLAGYFLADTLTTAPVVGSLASKANYIGRNLGYGNGFSTAAV